MNNREDLSIATLISCRFAVIYNCSYEIFYSNTFEKITKRFIALLNVSDGLVRSFDLYGKSRSNERKFFISAGNFVENTIVGYLASKLFFNFSERQGHELSSEV